MIDTNIKGLLYVTKTIAPLMIARGEGHIINVGSIAGREVYANGNVYCATKYAVDALTKGMRMDFSPYGIRVSQVAPGAVETEFSVVRFKGDQQRADAVYQGFRPLCAADIAGVIAYIINCPPHVNIADVLVLPTAQAGATTIHRT
jgi:NADP-dependent 3-hydroxy acid dehydrogenase YdfG